MTDVFLGIDFANIEAHHGQCWLTDDGAVLRAAFADPRQEPVMTAVDCPFGTSTGFAGLLRGELPGDNGDDGFKTRFTERLMRQHVAAFTINADWKAHDTKVRKALERVSFFNGGAHVQATLGLVIVPAMLDWLMRRLGGGSGAERLAGLATARRSEGPVLEAHPRLFLYSMMERIRHRGGAPIPVEDMAAIAGYKDKGADGEQGRKTAYDLIASKAAGWLPVGVTRQIDVPDLTTMLTVDHAFDAWLAALTAWAHHHRDTWTWQDAGLPHEAVDVEGHMLILRTTGKVS